MDKQTEKKYNYWQWRTLITLMIGYALYYFVRKHFSVVMPALESELGISKVQLGLFLTLNGIIYGISRFVNGLLADRFSRKILMSAGLLLSALTNFIICFSPSMNSFVNVLDAEGKATMTLVYIIGSLWVLNGYFQGMGVPPCISLMCHWIRPSELATKQSIWNASHSIGAGLISVMCGFILKHYGYSSWQLCFAIPAAIAVVGAIALFFTLKDTPSSVGLPEIEDMEKEEGKSQCEVEENKAKELSGTAFKKFVNKLVFGNPLIWILAVSNFCIYVVRFTILDWGTTFLTQFKGMEISAAGTVVAVSELFGGILGMLVAGWFTDKFMHSKAHRTCLICTIGRYAFILPVLEDAVRHAYTFSRIHMSVKLFHLRTSGAARNCSFSAGYQICLRYRQRHSRYLRLRQHSDFRYHLRFPRRPLRMGFCIPCFRNHRSCGRICNRPHVESPC